MSARDRATEVAIAQAPPPSWSGWPGKRQLLTLLQPHLYQLYQHAADRRNPRVRPTERQLEVLRCVALGMTNDETARQLSISPGTVSKHLENAYARLGVTSRTAAVARVFGNTGNT